MSASEPFYGVLNVDDIIVDDGFNCFAPLDEDTLFELGESLSEDGQLMPIVVNQTGDEEYHLIAGEQRLTALKAEGIETVECKILQEVDAVKAVRLHAIENIRRRKPKPMDEARVMKRLADLGQNTTQIAGVMKCSKDTVLTRMKLLDLVPEVQRMVDRANNPLPIHQAMLVARVPADRQLAVAVKIAPASGAIMGEAEARDLVDEELNGPRPITPPPVKKPSGPREISNIRRDPDKSADGGFEEITDDGWPAINAELGPSGTNDKGEFLRFATYRVPLADSSGIVVNALYARDIDDAWHSGFKVLTPATGNEQFLPNEKRGGVFDGATAAVANALMNCQDTLGYACEKATSKALKQQITDAIEKIGKRIQFLINGGEQAGAETPRYTEEEMSLETPPAVKKPTLTASQVNRIKIAKKARPVECAISFVGTMEVSKEDGSLVLRDTTAEVIIRSGGANCTFLIDSAKLDFGGDANADKVANLLKKS